MTLETGRLGIEAGDIQTRTFQVHERTVYDRETYETRREGFTANQTASVTIHDTGQADTIAGQLIEAVDGAGPAELVLQGVSSGVDNPEELRITALEKATMNLWEQARTVAETSDRRVCQLLEAQAGGAEQHHGQSGISFET